MSILFADIYDGIRAIRISKGVCERDILNYVQEKAGGCMKVLKTIRTLKKLVDEGELIKKGNRYCFPPKDECNEDEDEEEEEEEEEEAQDDDEGEELDMEPDECDECDDDGEEEEDEEEDEDDDDDDDDDDGEDDEDEDEDEEEESCDDDVGAAGSVDSQDPLGNENNPENTPAPKTPGEPDCVGAQKTVEVSHSRNGIPRDDESSTKNNEKKTNKDKNMLDQSNKPDRGEAIAFCARDFIDSLAESKSDKSSEEKIEITKASGREVKGQKRFSSASKKSQPPRKKSNVERYKSRSPLQGRKRDYSRVGQELSHNLGFTGLEKEILGESINSKMEMDVDTNVETFGVSQKSPARTSPVPEAQKELKDEKDRKNFLTETGTMNRSGSSGGVVENVPKETLKVTQLKAASYSNMIWYPLEDNDNAQDPLQECSSSFENKTVVARKDSLCSVCEKKKRIS